jgi:hypothetical protein
LVLLLFVQSVGTAIPPFQTIEKTRRFLASHIEMTPVERSTFLEMAYKGGGEAVVPTLACICLQETNNDRRLRLKYGLLGGDTRTILKGAWELGEKPSIAWLEDHPAQKTRYLAARYAYLYNLYGQNTEKTCRVWNQGPKWRSKKAQGYWNSICWFQKQYQKTN